MSYSWLQYKFCNCVGRYSGGSREEIVWKLGGWWRVLQGLFLERLGWALRLMNWTPLLSAGLCHSRSCCTDACWAELPPHWGCSVYSAPPHGGLWDGGSSHWLLAVLASCGNRLWRLLPGRALVETARGVCSHDIGSWASVALVIVQP